MRAQPRLLIGGHCGHRRGAGPAAGKTLAQRQPGRVPNSTGCDDPQPSDALQQADVVHAQLAQIGDMIPGDEGIAAPTGCLRHHQLQPLAVRQSHPGTGQQGGGERHGRATLPETDRTIGWGGVELRHWPDITVKGLKSSYIGGSSMVGRPVRKRQ